MALKYGDRGPDVVLLQQFLQAHTFNLGPSGVDGSFGKYTKEAVQAYQKGIQAPTGMVDAQLSLLMGFKHALMPGPASAVNTTLVLETKPFMSPDNPLTAPSKFDWRLGLALGGLVGFGLLMATKKGRASFSGTRARKRRR